MKATQQTKKATSADQPGATIRTIRPAGPVKVALFAPSMTWGGAEKMFKRLAIGFSDAGLSVDLVLATASGPNLKGLPATIRVVDLGCHRVLASTRPLARYLNKTRPDVLISTIHYANLVAVWARSFLGFSPQLILREANTMSVDAAGSAEIRDRVIFSLARMFYPRADIVVANSRGAANDLIENVGVPRSMVRVIYNPTFSDEMVPLMREPVLHPWFGDGGPPIVLSAGRLSVQKRFDLLIRAVVAVREHRPIRLIILGDGDERDRLESLVRELGGEQFVSLPGFGENPYAYMARADLFVLSSAWEGLPNVLIEALACGLPVVSTDCPNGPREILDTAVCGCGHLGTLAPPNDVAALSQAILQELAVKRDRNALKRYASRFHSDKAVRAYIDLMHVGGRP